MADGQCRANTGRVVRFLFFRHHHVPRQRTFVYYDVTERISHPFVRLYPLILYTVTVY